MSIENCIVKALILFFINLEAYAVVNAFKPVTFGAGAKNATRLESM